MNMKELQALRSRLQLSQADFARVLRVSIKTVQNWEQGRRSPTGPAAALLHIMDKEPHAAIRALHGTPSEEALDFSGSEEDPGSQSGQLNESG